MLIPATKEKQTNFDHVVVQSDSVHNNKLISYTGHVSHM